MSEYDKEMLVKIAAILGQRFENFGETFIQTPGSERGELAHSIMVQHEFGPMLQIYVKRDQRLATAIAEALNLFPKLVEMVLEKEESGDKANGES